MKLAKLLLLVCVVVLSTACASTADITAKSAYDETVNFKSLSKYSWQGIGAAINDPNGVWAPTDLDVKSELIWLVDRELSNRKFNKVKEDPDVLVVMGVIVDMENQTALVDYRQGIEQLFTLPKGALVVSLIDAKTNNVIWAGEAESQVQNNTDKSLVKKRLATAIKKMFKGFPK